jgi:hypothetical protein
MDYSSIKIEGVQTEHLHNVSVDTPHVTAQRKVYTNKADSYIKEVGSFDWSLFGIPLVVKYPNGRLEVADGGHRLWLLRQIMPEVKQVRVSIVDVKDEAEASRLFHRINGTCTKSVNNQEKFIAKFLGQESYALNIAKSLIQAKAFVESNGNIAGLDRPKGNSITIAKFEQLHKRNKTELIETCNMIHSVFDGESKYNAMLIEGIMTLRDKFKQYLTEWSSYEDDFLEFLECQAGIGKKQKNFTYSHLRKDNHYGISIAWGLYQDFNQWLEFMNRKTPKLYRKFETDYTEAGKQE